MILYKSCLKILLKIIQSIKIIKRETLQMVESGYPQWIINDDYYDYD